MIQRKSEGWLSGRRVGVVCYRQEVEKKSCIPFLVELVTSIKVEGPSEAPDGNNITLECIAKGGVRFTYTNLKNVQTAIEECIAFYVCYLYEEERKDE
ncbi:hypothetical protein DPMN_039169 [Dreissena polymorpha]|uniref:Uncharacterized protein n=1 Tax=Dreissena polymorpha TaxID=45954 RepID=A0A9D4ME40_DREPO|nr:hypothetical protein DPMN_039169 [Dreissena polymorpha]